MNMIIYALLAADQWPKQNDRAPCVSPSAHIAHRCIEYHLVDNKRWFYPSECSIFELICNKMVKWGDNDRKDANNNKIIGIQ